MDKHAVNDLPPGLEDRVLRALRDEGLVASPTSFSRTASRLVGLAAALSLAVGLGWALRDSRSPIEAAPPPDSELYALMLYADERYRPLQSAADAKARGTEYGDWGRERWGDGIGGVRFIEGMRLGGTAAVLGSDVPPPGLQPSGFFLVRASDEATVIRDARSHPQLKYGGLLVVRRVGATISPPP